MEAFKTLFISPRAQPPITWKQNEGSQSKGTDTNRKTIICTLYNNHVYPWCGEHCYYMFAFVWSFLDLFWENFEIENSVYQETSFLFS